MTHHHVGVVHSDYPDKGKETLLAQYARKEYM
jgi:hypothetical protein